MKIVTKKEINIIEKNIIQIEKLLKLIERTKTEIKLGMGSFILLSRMQMIGIKATETLKNLLDDNKRIYYYQEEKTNEQQK